MFLAILVFHFPRSRPYSSFCVHASLPMWAYACPFSVLHAPLYPSQHPSIVPPIDICAFLPFCRSALVGCRFLLILFPKNFSVV